MQNYFSYCYQNKILKTQIVSVIHPFTQKRLVEHQLIRHYITRQKYNNDKSKSSEKDIQTSNHTEEHKNLTYAGMSGKGILKR